MFIHVYTLYTYNIWFDDIYICACVCNLLLYIYSSVEFKCTSKYDYMKLCINILVIYIYIPGQSLSRIIFDLCGFSDAGPKITFGLRVMDSMTQFWCQKVGLSHHFASYFWSFQMWLTEGKHQQLFDFWSLTTFQYQTKMQLLDVQVCIVCIHMLHLP